MPWTSSFIRRRKWQPTPVLLPGESHGRRSLLAAVHGVTKSWTRLRDFTFTFYFSLSCTGEGNSNPLQCSCLENPRDGGAWWAAVYGVAQSRTRLKRLSSSSSFIHACELKFLSPFVALWKPSAVLLLPRFPLRSFLPYNWLKESSWVLSMDIQTWFYSLPLAPYAFRRNSEMISPSDLPTFLKNKVLLLKFPGTFNNLVNFQHLGDVQIINSEAFNSLFFFFLTVIMPDISSTLVCLYSFPWWKSSEKGKAELIAMLGNG